MMVAGEFDIPCPSLQADRSLVHSSGYCSGLAGFHTLGLISLDTVAKFDANAPLRDNNHQSLLVLPHHNDLYAQASQSYQEGLY